MRVDSKLVKSNLEMFLNISDIYFTKNQHVCVEKILKKHIYFLYTSLVIIKHVFVCTLLQSQYRLVYCLSFPHLTKPLNPTCSYITSTTCTNNFQGVNHDTHYRVQKLQGKNKDISYIVIIDSKYFTIS